MDLTAKSIVVLTSKVSNDLDKYLLRHSVFKVCLESDKVCSESDHMTSKILSILIDFIQAA